MSLFKDIKKNRPSVSIGLLKALGFPGLENSTDSDLGFEDLLEKVMFATGLNHIVQVNDCETSGDWAESDDGTLDFAVGATGNRVGTNCLLLTETAACDNSQYVSTAHIDESTIIAGVHGKRQIDWSDTKYLGFWVHNEDNGDFSVAGEASVAIVSDGVLQTKMPIQAIVDDVHQWFQVDMVAAGWDLTKVEEIRFYANNANTGENLYIDDIIRYQIAYNDAPLYGCSFPIASASALTNGDNVSWSIDGAIIGSATETIANLGMGELNAASSTGTAKRDKWVTIPGIHIFLARASETTIAGEGLVFSSATEVEGVTSGEDETVVCKGLEAGADHDDIFCVRGLGGTYISA